MAAIMLADRRRKSKALVRQQRHRRKHWWNRTDIERVSHLGACDECSKHFRKSQVNV